jgi:tetratricopeptide (TPR) repeat protein
LKEYGKAIADFSEALRLKFCPKDTLFRRALCYFETGCYAQAIDDYTTIIQSGDWADANIYPCIVFERRGKAYWKNKEPVKAIADFSETINNRRASPCGMLFSQDNEFYTNSLMRVK